MSLPRTKLRRKAISRFQAEFNRDLIDKQYDVVIIAGMNSKTKEWSVYSTDPREKEFDSLIVHTLEGCREVE